MSKVSVLLAYCHDEDLSYLHPKVEMLPNINNYK